MTPDPVAVLTGAAVLVVIWTPLWWLAGRCRPLSWQSLLALAIALTVIGWYRQDPVIMASTVIWAFHAGQARDCTGRNRSPGSLSERTR